MAQNPRKRFGQHWLRSDKVLNRIVAAAAVEPSDRILEIGPGTGVLTQRLISQAEAVVAVEIDRDLCRGLAQKFGKTESFLLLSGDILDLDLAQLLEPFPQFQQPNKVVANIPYYITGPILERLLGSLAQPNPRPFESIVLLIQREVAERLYAKPGSRNFGALSVKVQYLAECELICPVPASAFYPPPKVESAVVRLRPRPFPTPADDPRQLERLVKLGFASKRKMLRNNLKATVDRDLLTTWLEGLGADPQVRGEDLSVAQWVELSNRIGKQAGASEVSRVEP
jgi:16S rRNA (adenine1518-N6/adenine1519-N6)-dimethyltransferase